MKKNLLFVFIVLCVVLVWTIFSGEKPNRTVIKFASWGSQTETSILIPLIRDFEKQNPDIKVEFLHIPQNYFQKLHLLFASNLAPDVVFINNYYAPKYIKANLFEDLTQYVKKSDFFEASIKNFTNNGKIYVIPRDVSNVVVYYNKDIFRKNNITIPDENWTIKEYIDIAKKLSKDLNNDGTNDVWGTSFETDIIFWLPYLLSNCGSAFDKNGKILLNDDSKKMLYGYSDLANLLNVAPTKSQSASLTMAQLFLQEKLAMHISGRWLVPKYREEANFDWDIIPFPKGRCGSVVSIDASGYALSKSSQNKAEAIRFIEFISSKQSLEKLTQSGLIVPARKDVANSNVFLSSQKPKNAKYFVDVIDNGVVIPVNSNHQQEVDKLIQLIEPVFLGKK